MLHADKQTSRQADTRCMKSIFANAKLALCVFLSLAVWSISQTADAQAFSCDSEVQPVDTVWERGYRIWGVTNYTTSLYASGGSGLGVTLRDQGGGTFDQAIWWVSVAMSAQTWNDQAVGSALMLRGGSSCDALPASYATDPICCADHLASIERQCDSALGVTSPRCNGHPGQQGNRAFARVCASTIQGGNLTWQEGYSPTPVNNARLDIVGVMTHELGHALGVNHPKEGGVETGSQPPAVMLASATVAGQPRAMGNSARQRGLYPYDTRCVEEAWYDAGGLRQVRASNYAHSSGTNNYLAFARQPTLVSRIGVSPNGLVSIIWETRETLMRTATSPAWLGSYSSTAPLTWTGDNRWFGSGPWTEWQTNASETSAYLARALHNVWDWNTPTFLTAVRLAGGSFTRSSQLVCTDTACSSSGLVRTHQRVASTWDQYSGQLIRVVVEEVRADASQDARVMVSVGNHTGTVWRRLQAAGVRSHTGAGVACNNYQALSASGVPYDCIIAFSNLDSDVGAVFMRRFWVENLGSGNFQVRFDPETNAVNTSGTTSSVGHIEAWYHNNNWWVAFKRPHAGDPVEVWRSPSTQTWTLAGTIGPAINGPFHSNIGGSHVHLVEP